MITRMTTTLSLAMLMLARAATAAGPPSGPLTRCAPDAVISGTGCIDRYEASVWRVPDATSTNRALVARIQAGRATADAIVAAAATQLSARPPDDYAPCAVSGQDCANDIFA